MPAVSYTLFVDGLPAGPDLLDAVQRIEVEDHCDMADMLRLHLAVGVREDGSGWTVLDDDVFPRLANVRLQVNAGTGGPEPLIDAYVMETRAEFANDPGASVLEVVGMDPTVLMNLEEKVRPWPGMADGDIARTVFQEYGFELDIESTQPARAEVDGTTIQRGTDIQFSRGLAERNGFECYVEVDGPGRKTVGHFHAPRPERTPQGVLSVNLGPATNVDRFEVRYDMLRPATAQVTGLDVDSLAEQPAQARELSLVEQGNALTLATDRPRRVLLSRTGLARTDELQTLAQAEVDRSAWAITAEGELHTVAYGGVLRAKRPVEVRGAGREFSGLYYVQKVLHTLSPDSYTQQFTLRRNALGLTGRERFTDDGVLP